MYRCEAIRSVYERKGNCLDVHRVFSSLKPFLILRMLSEIAAIYLDDLELQGLIMFQIKELVYSVSQRALPN